jgi:hypothetical protein
MKRPLALALLVLALSPLHAVAQYPAYPPDCVYPMQWVWRSYWSCEYPAPVYYYPRPYYYTPYYRLHRDYVAPRYHGGYHGRGPHEGGRHSGGGRSGGHGGHGDRGGGHR